MANNDNFGPKWVVNSEEMGSGAAMLLALFAAAFVLAPAFLLGTWIAASIWNARIFKYPLGAVFAYWYFKGLSFIWIASHELAAAIVIASWILTDYVLANGKVRNMFIVSVFKKTFGWLFSA